MTTPTPDPIDDDGEFYIDAPDYQRQPKWQRVVTQRETELQAEVARLTAENEQLRAEVCRAAEVLDELAAVRARVQAVRDLCDTADSRFWHPQAPFVNAVRAAIGDGDDRG